MEKLNFFEFSLKELEDFVVEKGHKSFRARQLFQWVYAFGVTEVEEMTNLSKAFRHELVDWFDFILPTMMSERISQIDGTRKYLFDVGKNLSIETVMIPSEGRNTLCVSSEVGCNLACRFCFTGKQKLKKRLRASEIVGQFINVKKSLPQDIPLTNIVFMGMGEPLDNEIEVFKAIDILTEDLGINLSRKKITVSTSGLVDKIPLVTRAGVRLAVSLNGSDDITRDYVMPINKKWNIQTLLQACREHAKQSRDKVTLEYVLLKGVTDSLDDAKRLVKIARQVPCKVNIIPFNEHPGSGFERPSERSIQQFQNFLIQHDVHVLRRKTMGRDIYAACGQLNSVHQAQKQKIEEGVPVLMEKGRSFGLGSSQEIPPLNSFN